MFTQYFKIQLLCTVSILSLANTSHATENPMFSFASQIKGAGDQIITQTKATGDQIVAHLTNTNKDISEIRNQVTNTNKTLGEIQKILLKQRKSRKYIGALSLIVAAETAYIAYDKNINGFKSCIQNYMNQLFGGNAAELKPSAAPSQTPPAAPAPTLGTTDNSANQNPTTPNNN